MASLVPCRIAATELTGENVTKLADSVDIVIGVDTHKHTHTASYVAPGGGVEDVMTAKTTRAGYMQLLTAAVIGGPWGV